MSTSIITRVLDQLAAYTLFHRNKQIKTLQKMYNTRHLNNVGEATQG